MYRKRSNNGNHTYSVTKFNCWIPNTWRNVSDSRISWWLGWWDWSIQKGNILIKRSRAFFDVYLSKLISLLTESDRRHRFPLPNETPEVFRMLPEFLIEDITEFLSFTSKCVALLLHCSPVGNTDGTGCCIRTDTHHKSWKRHLKTNSWLSCSFSFRLPTWRILISRVNSSKWVIIRLFSPVWSLELIVDRFAQIMYYLSRPTYTSPRGCLGDVLNFHTLALKNLMPCLIHAYIGLSSSLSLFVYP